MMFHDGRSMDDQHGRISRCFRNPSFVFGGILWPLVSKLSSLTSVCRFSFESKLFRPSFIGFLIEWREPVGVNALKNI